MSNYTTTFSGRVEWALESGIRDVPVVPPGGEDWHIVNSSYLVETSQFYWVWKKDDAQSVVTEKPNSKTHSKVYIFSCDLTKKETWYVGSSGVSETFSADGIKTEFELAHGSGNGASVIDLSHGKVTDELAITTPASGSYIPLVEIDGTEKEEREVYEGEGGDYHIDYTGGRLIFYTAPSSGSSVDIDYYISASGSGPVLLAGPGPGKKWRIDFAEVQFSSDIVMEDSFVQNALVDFPVYDASGVYQHTLYDYSPGPDVVYHNVGNFVDFTNGAYPVIPPFGGGVRGLTNGTLTFRWDYASSIELLGSMNARFKIWTKHGKGYTGERAAVAIYGIETDE